METVKISPEDYKSTEEYHMALWCAEAKEAGYITDWAYEDKEYPLSGSVVDFKTTIHHTKTKGARFKEKEFTLLKAHSYTPDFRIWPEDKFFSMDHGLWRYTTPCKLFYSDGDDNIQPYVIDVKGTFQRFDGARSFSINQKWVFEKHRIYINKVVPPKFFKKTWVPEAAAYGKRGTRLKPYATCKLLEEL
jgi:hypothetical protein